MYSNFCHIRNINMKAICSNNRLNYLPVVVWVGVVVPAVVVSGLVVVPVVTVSGLVVVPAVVVAGDVAVAAVLVPKVSVVTSRKNMNVSITD